MASDSFGARRTLDVGGRSVDIFALDAATDDVGRLPYWLKVLLENLLRTEDGVTVTADDIGGAGRLGRRAEPATPRSPSRPPGC